MLEEGMIEEMILLYEFAVLGVVLTMGMTSGDGSTNQQDLEDRKNEYERKLAVLRTYAKPTTENLG